VLTVPHPLRTPAEGERVAVDALDPSGLPAAVLDVLGRAVRLEAGGSPIRRTALDATGLPPVPRMHPTGQPVDERSRVLVGADGIDVGAATDEGLFRAVTSIADELAATGSLPSGAIVDAPALGWRGLALDVARHPFTIEELDTVVEILASLKLNVLHLHLSDDQGWRLPVPARPELARVGGAMAMRGIGSAYEADAYRGFVRRAAARHVIVVPEIDLPGHTGALIASVPGIGAGEGVPGEYASRLHLDHRKPETFAVLRDVLAALRELHDTPYLHIGGDEAFGMPDEDFAAFFARFAAELDVDPRWLIGWQEAVRAGIGIGTLQVWRDLDLEGVETDPEARARLGLLDVAGLTDLTARGREDVRRISAGGTDVILSPVLTAYLDRPYAETDEAGRMPSAGLGAYLPRTVRMSFERGLRDTVPGLAPERVAGAEAALWTETIDDLETAERMLLPRLAGFAQHAWEHEPATWDAHRDRLAALRRRWDAAGWRHHRISLDDDALGAIGSD